MAASVISLAFKTKEAEYATTFIEMLFSFVCYKHYFSGFLGLGALQRPVFLCFKNQFWNKPFLEVVAMTQKKS